jgi:hypothetical protein
MVIGKHPFSIYSCPFFVVITWLSVHNSLLHSCSLSTWGVHDRDLLLRGALNRTMNGKHIAGFRRRWQVASKLRTENESKWAPRYRKTNTPLLSFLLIACFSWNIDGMN